MNKRLYWSAIALFALSYLLPATFIRSITGSGGEMSMRITAWGWQAGLYSIVPLLMAFQDPVDWGIWLMAIVYGSCNIGFIAAAILLLFRKRRAALVCIVVALASMIYAGFTIPAHQSELVGGPAGHLGPGYYAWVTAGALMLWTAFSSRSAA